ncbi:MAG TPA: sulfurtransferase [Bacteroidetes bacterium]|nr:sulfurtransferase [Bacteroidota bacterium]
MGPLVPEIIGNNLNLIIAFLIGIAFGYTLEQAGFSSSRRLAGLFYGYDFVVLRVFFTAAVTAMMGLIVLSFLGWIRLDLIYINPTFLTSVIIGGLIMGLGFILGGFCPGTSVTAAAIGKIDAIAFLVGIFTGIFIFAESFPLIRDLYTSGNLGNILVYESLGVPRGVFAFGLTVLAIAAFIVTSRIESRINGEERTESPLLRRRYSAAVGVAVVIGFVLIFMPDKTSRALNTVENHWQDAGQKIKKMDKDELAMMLINDENRLLLVDVRSAGEFEQSHIPLAVNIPFGKLTDVQWRNLLKDRRKTNIFYATDTETALKAALLSVELGDNGDVRILDEGFDVFNREILTFDVSNPHEKLSVDLEQFRRDARLKLEELAARAGGTTVQVKEVRKIKGGC